MFMLKREKELLFIRVFELFHAYVSVRSGQFVLVNDKMSLLKQKNK